MSLHLVAVLASASAASDFARAIVAALFIAPCCSGQCTAAATKSAVGPLTSVAASCRSLRGIAIVTWTGSVTSQGDALLSGAPAARSSFGVDGSGIKVGIISDSFDFLGGQTFGVLSGDLPGVGNPDGYLTPVNVLSDEFFPGNHRRRSRDRRNRPRPRARRRDPVSLGVQQSRNLRPADRSPRRSTISSPPAPTSSSTTCFPSARPSSRTASRPKPSTTPIANGVAYFSSAGNNSNNAYEGMYSPYFGNNHDFDANRDEGGDNVLDIGNIPNGGSVIAALWWDDAYASLGGTPTTDFRLRHSTTSPTASSKAARSPDQFAGADPFEALRLHQHQRSDQERTACSSSSPRGDPEQAAENPGLWPHDSRRRRHRLADSPADTTRPPARWPSGPRRFSIRIPPSRITAQGPTTILRDADGNLLAVARDSQHAARSPASTAATRRSSSSTSGIDADVFPNFFGTSASAPHVAAIAALVLERAAQLGQSLSPAELYDLLIHSTVDMGAPGYDYITGYGRLDAYAGGLGRVELVPEPGTIATMLWLACGRDRSAYSSSSAAPSSASRQSLTCLAAADSGLQWS